MRGLLFYFAFSALFWEIAPLRAENFGDLRNLSDAHTDSRFVPAHYRTLAEWQQQRARIRTQILTAAGLHPLPERTPLQLRRSHSTTFGDFVVEVVSFQPFPGLHIAANLYRPVRPRGRRPAVLVPHGHWKDGRIHDDEEYSVPKLCANLAMQGYTALAYDMLGYNESRQLPHKFGSSSEEQRWSFHPLGLQLWTAIRALDLLQSLPFVDAQRLAVTGASGGGTQTMLLAAVDERVRAAAPVVMVSAHFQGDDACEMAPGLRVNTNNVEIAAAIAPRPLLLISSSRDWTRNTPQVEYPAIRNIFRLYNAAERATIHHTDAKHNYNRESREAFYRFLYRHLPRAATRNPEPTEKPVPSLPDQALLWPKPFNEENGYPSRAQILNEWKQRARQQTLAASNDAVRDRLRAVVGLEDEDAIQALRLPQWMLLHRQGHGERIPARWMPGTSSTAIIVTQSGIESDSHQKLIEPYRTQAWNVLSIDPYQSGVASAPRPSPRKDYLVFHHSDDAYRIHDILTAIRYAGSPAVLACDKGASPWCLAAAALTPIPVKLELDETPAESSFLERVFLPGFERAGGFSTLLRLSRKP